MALSVTRRLTEFASRGVALLRIDADCQKLIEETRYGGTRFSLNFPHRIAAKARSESLALIAVQGESQCLRVGLIRSVQPTSTFDSRVVVDLVHSIAPGSLGALLSTVTEASLRTGVRNLENGEESLQSVTPKLRQRLIQAIAALPENSAALNRIIAQLGRPKRFDDARALQLDAVNLALRAFGPNDGASTFSLVGESALANVRLQEDAVIEHDARWIPGWRLKDSDLTGHAVFRRHAGELEVFTANKRPLEQLFGVDLIYLNRARGSLVMVQYKMMNPERDVSAKTHRANSTLVEKEWTVPIDRQFQAEMDRMARFDRDIQGEKPYRLNHGVFYFKFVKRHADTSTAGILLSKDHLDQMISEGAARGPYGGLRISYQALDGHYLRAEAFVELVHSGYIGSRGATTDHLQTLIKAALTGGRSVVAAIQTGMQLTTTGAIPDEFVPTDETDNG